MGVRGIFSAFDFQGVFKEFSGAFLVFSRNFQGVFSALTLQSLPFWQKKSEDFPLCRSLKVLGKEEENAMKLIIAKRKKQGNQKKRKDWKIRVCVCVFPIPPFFCGYPLNPEGPKIKKNRDFDRD